MRFVRPAVIVALMLATAGATGYAVHHRPNPVQQVILQPVHTVERIIEHHTAKRIKAPHRKSAPRRAPKGRQPGDDTANELNLRELR